MSRTARPRGLDGRRARRRTGRPRRPTPATPRITWPKEWGGRGGAADPAGDLRTRRSRSYAVPRGLFEIGLGMCMPDADAPAARETQKRPLRPRGAARRGGLVPALLRAGRRLRPRGPAHARRARRRRLGHQRPEDLDLGRALLRLRHPGHAHRPQRAQAQGADLLLPRHEVARHRDPADQADLRRRRTSTRCSSPTCASPTASASARSARAGRCRSPR